LKELYRQEDVMRAAALIPLVTCLGCGGGASPANPTTPSPPAESPSRTLSGQVFEVLPGGRIPAAGISLTAVIVVESSCSPPCTNKRTWVHEGTTSGPDGRYRFLLPVGPAIVLASSPSHQQICGAATNLRGSTELDVEITSKSNPQASPTMPPLTITGQIYETTPNGRVGLDGASVYTEWMAPDSGFMTFNADKNGRYTACGIPPHTQIAFWVFKTGYNDPYVWHEFNENGSVDIELTRK
jgi:hypothetical protein